MARPLPALRIRRALPSDLPSILALDRDLMGPTYAPTVASTVAWWVATSDGQVAAYASAHRSASWVDCVYLARAGVAPALPRARPATAPHPRARALGARVGRCVGHYGHVAR